jgi:serine protease inhibitor
LDLDTTAKIINDLYFINNHFSPQLFWIINLRRFSTCNIRINHIDSLQQHTEYRLNESSKYNQLDSYFRDNQQLKYYILDIDSVLYENCMNKTVSFSEIISEFETFYPEIYADTVRYAKEIISVLP